LETDIEALESGGTRIMLSKEDAAVVFIAGPDGTGKEFRMVMPRNNAYPALLALLVTLAGRLISDQAFYEEMHAWLVERTEGGVRH
jgi:hypothetical protein